MYFLVGLDDLGLWIIF